MWFHGLIEPVHPKPGNGRPPIGVERMLRIYIPQFVGPGGGRDAPRLLAMRRFVGIELGRGPMPDETTTVCRFGHLLEEHYLGRSLFEEVQRHPAEKGLRVTAGTIADATIINTPSSTKNAQKASTAAPSLFTRWWRRRPMRRQPGAARSVAQKRASVWGDQAYHGHRAMILRYAPQAQDFVNRRYRHRGVVDMVGRAKNRTKSKVRATVEHPIGVLNRVFGFAKRRYRDLKKNAHRLTVTRALANLFVTRGHLLRCQDA